MKSKFWSNERKKKKEAVEWIRCAVEWIPRAWDSPCALCLAWSTLTIFRTRVEREPCAYGMHGQRGAYHKGIPNKGCFRVVILADFFTACLERSQLNTKSTLFLYGLSNAIMNRSFSSMSFSPLSRSV